MDSTAWRKLLVDGRLECLTLGLSSCMGACPSLSFVVFLRLLKNDDFCLKACGGIGPASAGSAGAAVAAGAFVMGECGRGPALEGVCGVRIVLCSCRFVSTCNGGSCGGAALVVAACPFEGPNMRLKKPGLSLAGDFGAALGSGRDLEPSLEVYPDAVKFEEASRLAWLLEGASIELVTR